MAELDSIRIKRNLTALVEFGKIINSSLNLDFILNNTLLTCLGKFLATRGIIALKEKEKLVIKISKGIPQNLISEFPTDKFNENFSEVKLADFSSKAKIKICERITSSSDMLGILCMGNKLNETEYTEDDRDFLKTILNIAATAIQNSMIVEELKELNRELDSKIQRLNSLFELSKEFGLFSDTKRIQRLLILSLMGQFLVSKYAILSLNEFDIQILDSKYNPEELQKKIRTIDYLKIDSTLKPETIQQKYPELDELGINLIVPMKIQNKLKGLILLGKRINNTDFSDSDIEFIYSVGSLAIISLENQRLLQEEIEKQKLEEEIELAKQIQQNLLPSEIPTSEVFEIAAINLPSKQVGGDYFDVIRTEKNKLITSIADVSGKGIPASLLMANLQAFIKLIIQQEFELDKAMAIINDLLTQNTSDGRFITFFWGILDEKEKSYDYVNAGHNPPILIRNGEIIRLSEGGIILGVMKTIIPYNKNKIFLQPGDMLVLFTDGVSEAMNINSEEFGEDRLEDLCRKISAFSSQTALDLIKKELELFTQGAPQSDDLTLMVIKVS